MQTFPKSDGVNCFLELVKNLAAYKFNSQISVDDLYFACGSLAFTYKSKRINKEDLFPEIDLLQENNFSNIEEFMGIKVEKHFEANEQEALQKLIDLLGYQIPIIQAAGTIEIVGENFGPTYLAAYNFDIEQMSLEITGLKYNGKISVENLVKMMKEVVHFNVVPYNWIELHATEVDILFKKQNLKNLFREKVKEYMFFDSSAYNNFYMDLKEMKDFNPMISKLIMSNLTNQMYHPWGPVTTKKYYFNVMKGLLDEKLISDKVFNCFEEMKDEYERMQILMRKYCLTEKKELLDRILNKINVLSDLECNLVYQIKKED